MQYIHFLYLRTVQMLALYALYCGNGTETVVQPYSFKIVMELQINGFKTVMVMGK